MIIQTGMRTDIPAFYAQWFANRLRAGFVYTRNPYCNEQVTEYSLSPDVVDLIAFCTKNPAPMFQYMGLLKPYGQYWFVTITPYGKDVEPNVPAAEKVIQDFKILSDTVGVNCVGWRYDPIIVTDRLTVDWHIEQFRKMAKELCGYTKTAVISFVDIYKKVARNMPEAREITPNERFAVGLAFADIAEEYGFTIKPCAEGDDLARFGADCGGCMTKQTFETALGARLNAPKIKSQRAQCACLLGKDIGEYNTCGHLCKYCYANADAAIVKSNMKKHDPFSPFLIGGRMPSDKIHKAEQKSWRDGQLKFF